MSDGPFGLPPGSAPQRPPQGRSEVREGARERARELRELHKKQDRNRRRIVTLSVVGGVLVIVVVIALVLLNFAQPTGRGPLNMLSDGIKIGTGYKAVQTPGIPANSKPVPSASNPPAVIDIKLYVDYLCPNCGTFEKKNGDQLRAWVKSGAATIEIHPIAVLTTKSAGTQYSLRAANAAACVAEFSPDHFFDFNDALFVDQPKEGTAGLTDPQIEARASNAGVTGMTDVIKCIEDQPLPRLGAGGNDARTERTDSGSRCQDDRRNADHHRQRHPVQVHDRVRPERVRPVRAAGRGRLVHEEPVAVADALDVEPQRLADRGLAQFCNGRDQAVEAQSGAADEVFDVIGTAGSAQADEAVLLGPGQLGAGRRRAEIDGDEGDPAHPRMPRASR